MKMSLACKVLLQIAEKPLDFSHSLGLTDDKTSTGDVSRLARQASASVVLNCASELWSTAVTCLLTMEPAFPFSEDVAQFVKDSRMPWIYYLCWVYKICNCRFNGTSSQEKAKVIIELRDEIIHNKPEPIDHLNEKAITSWRNKLKGLVGKDAFDWLPCVGHIIEKDESHIEYYSDGSEPTIMKFMKYPIAKWAFETTTELCDEMLAMTRKYSGPKKVTEVASSTCNPDPLWLSGKLIGERITGHH